MLIDVPPLFTWADLLAACAKATGYKWRENKQRDIKAQVILKQRVSDLGCERMVCCGNKFWAKKELRESLDKDDLQSSLAYKMYKELDGLGGFKFKLGKNVVEV